SVMCVLVSGLLLALQARLGDGFVFLSPSHSKIYTLSLHDALPICCGRRERPTRRIPGTGTTPPRNTARRRHRSRRFRALPTLPIDRKSTRLNSSHVKISYAVFCLKKKTEDSHAANSSTHPQRTLHR